MVYQIIKQIKYLKNDLVMSNTTRNIQKKTKLHDYKDTSVVISPSHKD